MPIAESREQTCWVESKCKHKRNHYRNRDRKLDSKKQQYAKDTGKVLLTKFEIVPDTYRAELVLYGNRPNKLGQVKGGVAAFQVLIFRGSKLVSESNQVSCKGMVQADLEQALDKALEQIGELYDVGVFGNVIWR